MSEPEKRESIEEIVYAALRDSGQLLPRTVEDVRRAEKELEANPVEVPGLRCAMCGELIPPDPEWSDADARTEAASKGVDPDESDVVCDDCYKLTPWGEPESPTEATPDA